MSFQALAAVRDLPTANAHVVLLLYVLGQYAQADGSCFPSIETLAEDSHLSTSAVRKALKEAEVAGLIRREERVRKDGGRSSNRIILTYCERPDLADDLDVAGGHKPRKAPRKVSHPPTQYEGGSLSNTKGVPLQYEGAFLKQDSLITEGSEEPTHRVGGLDDVVREIWAAWPSAGREHSSERLVADAVVAELGAGAVLADVRAGSLAYAAKPSAHGASGSKPKAPHTFLAEGRWKTHRPRADQHAPVVTPRIQFADAEVRAALFGAMGEAWVVSWLDPCGWDKGKREVDPRIKRRADKLGEHRPAEELTKLGVVVRKVG